MIRALIALVLFVFCAVCRAPAATTTSVTIEAWFGIAYDSSNNEVATNTLWVLVADSNDDHVLPGLATLNSSVNSSIFNFFPVGKSIALGDTIGTGDTVFAIGDFDNSQNGGLVAQALNLTIGVNGISPGINYAFYFFPGSLYAGNDSGIVGTQVGGLNAEADVTNGLDGGMVIPPAGQTVNGGAFSPDFGGRMTRQQFRALQNVPEPSFVAAATFVGLGTLILRRRQLV